LDAADRTRVFDVFKNSGNQALQLYSDYDLLLTTPVPGMTQPAKAQYATPAANT
jgi:hypothetical protein